MATVKEFYLDKATGSIEVELDDNSVFTYKMSDVIHQDPSTGALVGSSNKIVGAAIAPAATSESTGVTDFNALSAHITAASIAALPRIRIPRGTYILSQGLTMVSNLIIEFDPGTVLKFAASTAQTCSVTSGSAVVTVQNTSGLRVGMHVHDTASNLQTNDPFGALAGNAKILSIDSATQITLSVNASATGTKTLRFYINDNIITVPSGISNWGLVCNGGWAYLDGNESDSYPYNLASDDATGNGLRMVSPTNFTIDGVCGRSNRFHGAIGVGSADRGNILRWRGESNGFRGWHMHGEAISGNATPAQRDLMYGLVECEGNGHRAWLTTRGGDENNSGFFAVFDNTLNNQVGIIRCKNEYGFGIHIAGGSGAFDPNFLSKHNSISNAVMDSCATGVFVTLGAGATTISSLQVQSEPIYISTNCATLAAASTTRYFQPASGGTTTALIKAIQLPANSISTLGIRGGMRCIMSAGSTGMASSGVIVLFVQAGAGAGGTDLVWVYNESNQAADPYTTANTGLYAYFFPCRDYGVYHSEASGKSQKGFKMGQVFMRNPGRYAWASNYSATQLRYFDLSCDSLTVEGTTGQALLLSSVSGLKIGKYHQVNCANQARHAGGVSGSNNSFLQNCADFVIDCFTSDHNLTATNDNESLRCDADCRNGVVRAIGLKVPSSGDTINILTTSGAGANASGKSGPIILDNPKSSTGTDLTVAGSHITRTAASACIVTRPVDA